MAADSTVDVAADVTQVDTGAREAGSEDSDHGDGESSATDAPSSDGGGPEVSASDGDTGDVTAADASGANEAASSDGDSAADSVSDGSTGDVTVVGDAGASEGGGALACTTCAAGLKNCSGRCTSPNDPGFGCAAPGCTPCPTGPGYSYVTMTCVAGECAVGQCPAGRADCDGNPANGCEADLDAPQTCGSCTSSCTGSQVCQNGSCQASCPFPATNCSGACRDPSTDPEACGACGNACPSVGGTPSCTSGTCGFTCDAPGWTACSNSCCAPVTACYAGFSLCGGQCVDEQSDPANCDGCGHACSSGTVCIVGQCVAPPSVQLITGLQGPGDIVVDAKNVYFIDNGTVWQANKTTLALTQLGSANEASPQRIAVSATQVYWTSKTGNAIRTAPIGGGPVSTLYAASSPTGIAVDSSNVYWSDDGTGQLLRAPQMIADGAGPFVLASSTTMVTLTSSDLRLDNGQLLGDAKGFVGPLLNQQPIMFSVDTALGSYTIVATTTRPNSTFLLVAFNSSDEFYEQTSLPGDCVILQGVKSGSLASTCMAGLYAYGIAGDDCKLYWSGGYTIAGIWSVAFDGAPPALITSAVQSPNRIAIDDSYVYWTDSTWIGRVTK